MTAPSWHVESSGYQAKVLRQRENGDSDGKFEEALDGTGQVHCAPCTLAAKFHLANLEAAAREGSGDERGQAYAAARSACSKRREIGANRQTNRSQTLTPTRRMEHSGTGTQRASQSTRRRSSNDAFRTESMRGSHPADRTMHGCSKQSSMPARESCMRCAATSTTSEWRRTKHCDRQPAS